MFKHWPTCPKCRAMMTLSRITYMDGDQVRSGFECVPCKLPFPELPVPELAK